MVKVSIVIPVYNRKNFLTVCIKSLLAQSFEDFEICLVDDGSTDGTGLLCDELAEKDTRIRVLHVQNGGAAYARQKGVELATGEWVVFVDSDDTMPADALQRLFQATSEDTDIVVGFCRKKRLWGVNRLSPACYRKLLIKGRYNISATCGKLFRRTLFDEYTLRTPREIVMGEDMLMNLRLAFASSKPVRLVGGNRGRRCRGRTSAPPPGRRRSRRCRNRRSCRRGTCRPSCRPCGACRSPNRR